MKRSISLSTCLSLTLLLTLVMATNSPAGACPDKDDFEDGVIDTGRWTVGGAPRGWDPGNPPDTGNWQYEHKEVMNPVDGYLMAHVWGPESGNSYGAEAWVRTNYNFNDGKPYIINFTWEPKFAEDHHNVYFIQVTNGYISEENNIHWARQPNVPGTVDLLWDPDPSVDYRGQPVSKEPGKLTWSIEIDLDYLEPPWPGVPIPVATLYDGPDATGWVLNTEKLLKNEPWYIRFMVVDGTSAGYPAGDAQLNLYDYECIPEPATVLLLGLGGLVLKRRRA
jgi:hypothetical protein